MELLLLKCKRAHVEIKGTEHFTLYQNKCNICTSYDSKYRA